MISGSYCDVVRVILGLGLETAILYGRLLVKENRRKDEMIDKCK